MYCSASLPQALPPILLEAATFTHFLVFSHNQMHILTFLLGLTPVAALFLSEEVAGGVASVFGGPVGRKGREWCHGLLVWQLPPTTQATLCWGRWW